VRRGDFDHVIAAAADVTGETELVVVGSQAILGPFPDAPESMLRSMEADLYPRRAPEKADEIDGSLGDGSRFHRTYGYYAHGVGPETAKAPAGWEARLIAVEIAARISSRQRVVALCLEPHDLVLAKCVAGRERDWEFAREALAHHLVDAQVLLGRIDDLPVDEEHRHHIRVRLEATARA
jgi:Nucleotidyltransferase of unknown function (DUF6036)